MLLPRTVRDQEHPTCNSSSKAKNRAAPMPVSDRSRRPVGIVVLDDEMLSHVVGGVDACGRAGTAGDGSAPAQLGATR